MKRFTLLFLITLTTCIIAKADLNTEAVRVYADNWGNFYGYLAQKIEYPAGARAESHQGNSIITFTITQGSLKNLNVQTELGKGCDLAILNSLMAYPQFKAIKEGKYALKVSFRLQGTNSKIINEFAKMPTGFTPLNTVHIAAGMPLTAQQNNTIGNDEETIKFSGNGIAKTPLYIVDGKVVDINLSELEPNQIKSLTLLKDASAIAFYGKGAENGVLVITTKKGDEQTLKGKAGASKATGNGSKVILRGENLFTPLYVVDGKVVDINLSELEPNQIKSLTILKDASAIALYGKGAENGVVVITTKDEEQTLKGKEDVVNATGNGSRVVLRGENSFLNNTPLYVVDGKVIDINLSELEPNQIKSLTILKDASAIDLYGKGAENGVIVITTKKDALQKTKK